MIRSIDSKDGMNSTDRLVAGKAEETEFSPWAISWQCKNLAVNNNQNKIGLHLYNKARKKQEMCLDEA